MTADDKVKELLGRVASTRKSAQFKAVLPFVAEQLNLGAQQQDILTVLNRCGLDINLKTFYTYLFRVRQAGELDRLNTSLLTPHAPTFPVATELTGSPAPGAGFTMPPNSTMPPSAAAPQPDTEVVPSNAPVQGPPLPTAPVVEIAELGKYEPDYAQFKKLAKTIASTPNELPAKK